MFAAQLFLASPLLSPNSLSICIFRPTEDTIQRIESLHFLMKTVMAHILGVIPCFSFLLQSSKYIDLVELIREITSFRPLMDWSGRWVVVEVLAALLLALFLSPRYHHLEIVAIRILLVWHFEIALAVIRHEDLLVNLFLSGPLWVIIHHALELAVGSTKISLINTILWPIFNLSCVIILSEQIFSAWIIGIHAIAELMCHHWGLANDASTRCCDVSIVSWLISVLFQVARIT